MKAVTETPTERRRRYARTYYLKNKERLKPIRKAWLSRNKKKWVAYADRWRRENGARCCGYNRKWASRYPDRARETWKKWDEAHPEKRKQVARRYRKRHPEVAVRHNTIRRQRAVAFDHYQPLIDLMVREVSQLPKVVCSYCKEDIEGTVHFDHIVPISRGGKHVRENLCVACERCNLSKGSKLLTEWKNGIYAKR